jgi:hypothetical protein
LEFRVSLVDQKTFVVQSTFGGTDRPFRFFYLRLLLRTKKNRYFY